MLDKRIFLKTHDREVVLMGIRYHNYAQYLLAWTNTSLPYYPDLKNRPAPIGILYDNTTVQGSWVETRDMNSRSITQDRTITNVSMAFPHAGVFSAARDHHNPILQPSDSEVRTVLVSLKPDIDCSLELWWISSLSLRSIAGDQCIMRLVDRKRAVSTCLHDLALV